MAWWWWGRFEEHRAGRQHPPKTLWRTRGPEEVKEQEYGACMHIVICKVFGLHPQFLAHRSQIPWGFLSLESEKGIFWMLIFGF